MIAPDASGNGQVAPSALAAALEDADLRVLLLCLFQATGDEGWLRSPFEPQRDVRLIADPSAGLPADVQRGMRTAAAEVFAEPRPLAVPAPTDDELLVRMMSHCLGEPVPPEYAPMIAADLGFSDRPARAGAGPDIAGAPPHGGWPDVIVIGAGVSGLCLGARLAEQEVPFTIIEAHGDIGGTWLENTYPGCGVDTPNHFYSYSFAPNPAWSRHFSLRAEIHDYLRGVCTAHALTDRIRFSTRVLGATWDDDAGRWQVHLERADGGRETTTCAVLVSATGHFNQPHHAPLDGLDDFDGTVVHTARWTEGTDVSDARVAVVGTGASAMQLVPTIADRVAGLTVFQRTPQWVRPVEGYGSEVGPGTSLLLRTIPNYARWYRFTQFWRYGDGLLRHLRRDPQWPHPDRSLNRVNDRHRQEMTDFIHAELEGRPDLIDRCVPDYPPFAKRILIDNGWYRTLTRPHVDLVTDPIDRVEAAGIRTADGVLHPADVIVLATGFTVTDLTARMDIRGRGGVRLADDWAGANPTAYLGISVPRFPNMLLMYGPNTNMGHGGSGMWLAETQTDYIVSALQRMRAQALAALDVQEGSRAAYTAVVDRLHAGLVWSHPGMSTYYRNDAGQVRSPMPFRLVDYWHMTRRVDLDHYQLTRSAIR